jgi:hypothetical protein
MYIECGICVLAVLCANGQLLNTGSRKKHQIQDLLEFCCADLNARALYQMVSTILYTQCGTVKQTMLQLETWYHASPSRFMCQDLRKKDNNRTTTYLKIISYVRHIMAITLGGYRRPSKSHTSKHKLHSFVIYPFLITYVMAGLHVKHWSRLVPAWRVEAEGG